MWLLPSAPRFNTIAEAEAWKAEHCVPTVNADEELPVPPIPETDFCGRLRFLQVGTPEWCDYLDNMLNVFADMGNWAAKNILGLDFDRCIQDPNTVFVPGSNPFPTEDPSKKDVVVAILKGLFNPLSLASDALLTASGNAIAEAIVKWFEKFIAYTLKGVGATDQFAASVAESKNIGDIFASAKSNLCSVYVKLVSCAGCDPIKLLGLLALKTMLDIFRNLATDVIIGVNFIGCAWWKIGSKLVLEIPQLRETVEYCIKYVCSEKIPEKGEIIEMVARGVITERHGTTLFKCYGYPAFWMMNEIKAKRAHLSAHEIIQADRRGFNDVAPLDELLDRHGYHDQNELDMVKKLYDHVPSVQDWLHYMQRSVFDPIYIEQFRLAEQFANEQITQDEIAKLRANSTPGQERPFFWDVVQKDMAAQGHTRSQSFLDWCGHWLIPGRGDLGQAMQRLRPGRVDPDIAFTPEQFRLSLQEQDVAPFWRKRYEYMAYNVMSIRQLLQLYEFSSITREELVEVLKDEGYKQSDADMLAKALDQRKALYRASTAHGMTVPKIMEFYRMDIISEEIARVELTKLGVTSDEAATAFDVSDNEARVEHKKHMLSITKKCYDTGKLTDAQAANQLQQQGWTDRRILDIIQQWRSERLCSMHDATAGQILGAWMKGIVSASTVAQQLLTLNYTPSTVGLLMAVTLHDIQAKQGKAKAAAQKQAEALAKAIQRSLTQQLKSDKRKAKIKLDLEKAIERANDMLEQAEEKAKHKHDSSFNKQNAAGAAATARAKAIRDEAAVRNILTPKLTTAQKEEMEDRILDVKNQLTIDLAQTKGALEKAQLRVIAAINIADIKDDYLLPDVPPNDAKAKLAEIRAQLGLDLNDIKNELLKKEAGDGQPDESTKKKIRHLIDEARDKFDVEMLPPI